MLAAFRADHLSIQAFAIFSDILHQQEDASEGLKARLLLTKHYGYNCLCRLDTLLRLGQSPATEFMTSSVMPGPVKEYVTSEDKRGWEVTYITLVQAKKRVQILKKEYEELSKTL